VKFLTHFTGLFILWSWYSEPILQSCAWSAFSACTCVELQVPSTEIDKVASKFFTHWDPDSRMFMVMDCRTPGAVLHWKVFSCPNAHSQIQFTSWEKEAIVDSASVSDWGLFGAHW
jgi:hypothetical protein